MRTRRTLVGLMAATLTTAAVAVELTTDNFYQKTLGKVVFLKFCDPNHSRCKKIESAWNRLSQAYENSPRKLIGEIDCTSKEAQELCADLEVRKYPTLKYGDVSNLQTHKGRQDFEALQQFAQDNLQPTCGVHKHQLCDKPTRKEIRRLKKMSLAELETEIQAKEDYLEQMAQFEKTFAASLSHQHETAEAKRDAEEERILGSGFQTMKMVAAYRRIKLGKRGERVENEPEESPGTCQSEAAAEEGTCSSSSQNSPTYITEPRDI